MRQGRLRAATALVAAIPIYSLAQTCVAAPRTVAVTAIVQHPALDAVVEGLRDGLARLGYRDGTDLVITYESAQGNPAIAAEIAQRYVSDPPDLIVAISTPSAQAIAAATKDIPVIFSAVTDPLAAGLVTSLEVPGANLTGVSDNTQVEDTLDLILQITPGVRRLGFLLNPDEANSIATRNVLVEAASRSQIEVIEAPAKSAQDVPSATRSLIGRVDAIFAPNDNTVVQAVDTVAELALEARLPLYAADPQNVDRGALAALGVDYRQIGTLTSEIADRVLKGERAGDIPVAFAAGVNVHLNRRTADAIGVTFTPATLKQAVRVIE